MTAFGHGCSTGGLGAQTSPDTVLGALHARGLCALFSALGHGQTSSIDASQTDEQTQSWCAQATRA